MSEFQEKRKSKRIGINVKIKLQKEKIPRLKRIGSYVLRRRFLQAGRPMSMKQLLSRPIFRVSQLIDP